MSDEFRERAADLFQAAFTLEAGQVPPSAVRGFQEMILSFYRAFGRDLPWRGTRDPYHILVSEIMLQQTQVDRVITKYGQFIEAFPGFESLDCAPLSEILPVWQGMGYNRRAIALKEIARKVVAEHNGILPANPEALSAFPGIGRATAASICVFAFNLPLVFIETNIRSLFIHFFFRGSEMVRDREIEPLVEQTLYREDPCTWYSALMDFGVHLKKLHKNPGRRSAEYKKQAPFRGSSRQVRGMILRSLSGGAMRTADEMQKNFGVEAAVIEKLLRNLEREGFIAEEKGRYRIC
jgi:A/G-specific adenine glycosylase